MNSHTTRNFIARNTFVSAAALFIASCATIYQPGSDDTIQKLRNFHLAFIKEFAAPKKRFNAAAFDAKVNEGNTMFQQAIANEKFPARRPVLVDLKAQFD